MDASKQYHCSDPLCAHPDADGIEIVPGSDRCLRCYQRWLADIVESSTSYLDTDRTAGEFRDACLAADLVADPDVQAALVRLLKQQGREVWR